MTRLRQLLNLIESMLGDLNPLVRVVEHYVDAEEDVEYIHVGTTLPHFNALL